jgi:hypothetical protein
MPWFSFGNSVVVLQTQDLYFLGSNRKAQRFENIVWKQLLDVNGKT